MYINLKISKGLGHNVEMHMYVFFVVNTSFLHNQMWKHMCKNLFFYKDATTRQMYIINWQLSVYLIANFKQQNSELEDFCIIFSIY